MRNLILLFNAHLNIGISGGDERTLEILSRWMREGRACISVITDPYISKVMRDRKLNPEKVYVTSAQKEKIGILTYLFRARDAKRYLKGICTEEKKDQVTLYSVSSFAPDVLPAAAIRKRNQNIRWCAAVNHVNTNFRKRAGNKLRNWIAYEEQNFCLHKIRRYADRVLAAGPEVYQFMLDSGIERRKLVQVSNGINEDELRDVEERNTKDLPDSEGSPDNLMTGKQYDGIFVGRLSREKGYRDLPDVWNIVNNSMPGATLCIVGDGIPGEIEKGKDDFRERGLLEQITFTGPVPHRDVLDKLIKSRVLISPSYGESWGMAVTEALACGIPCVTYDLPAFRKIYKDVYCPVTLYNTKEMADQVVNLLINPERAVELGRRGRELVLENYSWEKIAADEWKWMTLWDAEE